MYIYKIRTTLTMKKFSFIIPSQASPVGCTT